MELKKNIFVLILLVFIGCSKEKNKTKKTVIKTEIESNDIHQYGKAFIIGKSDDEKALKYFGFGDFSTLSSKVKDYGKKKEIIEDSIFITVDSIGKSQYFVLSAFGSKGSYLAKLVLKPYDTIIFEIKNKKLRFIGNNAPENNFYSELRDSTFKYTENSYKGNLQLYKTITDSIYAEKLAFLNRYVQKHGTISESFVKTVKLDLKYEHLSALLHPEKTRLNHTIEKEYAYHEDLFDYESYLGNIELNEFKNVDNLNLLNYRGAIYPLISNYFENSDNLSFSKEKLLAEKKFIDNNFEGKMKEFLLSVLIFHYHANGFAKSQNSAAFFKRIIHDFEKDYPQSSFKESIERVKNDLTSLDFNIPDAALDTKLISTLGDTITLREIFSRSTKRIKVVDFWASWCPPCIDEITKVKSFRDKLAIEDNVEWIYLSLDESKESWLKKSKELDYYLNVTNQYIVVGGYDSPLAKALKIKWIPRYLIFNKQNEIVLNNSPRPSNSYAFKKIIDSIK